MTVVPPLNFAVVENGIYRSGHPVPINFPFIATKLRLKTVIYLGDKTDNDEYYEFLEEQGIKFHHIQMKSVKEPFKMNDPEAINKAMEMVLDVDNYPILVHSNKGKHRVGVLVGIIRKILQGWSSTGVFEEYDRFSGGKGEVDMEFVENFEYSLVCEKEKLPEFVRMA